MNVFVLLVVTLAVLGLGIRFYPPWIARVFGENDRNLPPSVQYADGRDFVESRSHVVFGHHFATIAGAGPIVGPTLALAFGWQPVWLWVVLGGVLFGAVHDMSSMFVSMREGGRSIGEVAHRALGPLGYLLYLVVLIFVLTIVNAIFLNLSVTTLTSMYPLEALKLAPDQRLLPTAVVDGVVNGRIGGIATTSVFVITGFAPVLGWLIRRGRIATGSAYLLAFAIAAFSVLVGFAAPVTLSGEAWRPIMTLYVLLACALPVWAILQPRDFTNVQLLYGGIALLVVSALVSGLVHGASLAMPPWDLAAGRAAVQGGVWPLLFITVACGAISGFHSLVSSGTTVKQIPRESDCRKIGYNAMILESLLAVLVIIAVGSTLPPQEYAAIVYPNGAPSNPILGFSLAAGRLIHAAFPFVSVAVATVLGVLMVGGFVVTTLDSSVRLARYLIEEFWRFAFRGRAPRALLHPVFNATLVVAMMYGFAVSGTVRQMWPVFGAGNQILAALALATVSVWLVQRARRYVFVLVPAVFMIATTAAALVVLVQTNLVGGTNRILGATSAVLLLLSLGVIVLGAARFSDAIQRVSSASTGPAAPPGTAE